MSQMFGFKAIKPIQAEHPVGSGQVVTYQPGDEVPAGEWGRAAGNLIESGKIMRYAITDTAPASPPPPAAKAEEPAVAAELVIVVPDDAVYPVKGHGNVYLLSDGTQVKGKAPAVAAQAKIDISNEAKGEGMGEEDEVVEDETVEDDGDESEDETDGEDEAEAEA